MEHFGWETWKGKRKCIGRNSRGQFVKGNFHVPEYWRKRIVDGLLGRKLSKETKDKISNTLKGQPFSEKRKKNISEGTRKSFRKYSKVCPHGVIPIYKCKICNSQYRQYLIRKGVNVDE